MDKIEEDELKRKFELRKSAEKANKTIDYSQHYLEDVTSALYESYQNGENVYYEIFVNSPNRLVHYRLYSCDFEWTTKEQFLFVAQNTNNALENAKDIIVRNGSYKLPEKMLEDFDKGSDTIYVFNGNNGVSAVFDKYNLDVRTDKDFLDYANILLTGQTKEEERQADDEIERKAQLDKTKKIEEIKKQIPQWITEGDALIYKEKQEEWKEYIERFKGDNIVYAPIVGQALEIMKCLDSSKSLIEAEQVLEKQGHSGESLTAVVDIVFRFSKQGPDFYQDVLRYVQKQEINEETARKIQNQRADNNSYAHQEFIQNGGYSISTTEIGKATVNILTSAKQDAKQVETNEKTKDNIKEGEEFGDDN